MSYSCFSSKDLTLMFESLIYCYVINSLSGLRSLPVFEVDIVELVFLGNDCLSL